MKILLQLVAILTLTPGISNNERIAKIASRIYENGGVIGVAGHGAVSLLNIKLSDGSFLVNGKKITCLPKTISARWLPVDWEQGLKDRGAVVVLPVTAEEKENGVQLTDHNGRIISGTYAENASWVAQQIAWRRCIYCITYISQNIK